MIASAHEDEYFRCIWVSINDRTLINVQKRLYQEWILQRRRHVPIILLQLKGGVAVQSSRIAVLSKSRKQRKKVTLPRYREILNCLLETYATHDVITEMDAEFYDLLRGET